MTVDTALYATATFTLLEDSLIGNDLKPAGTTGVRLPVGTLPGPNLQAENADAEILAAAYEASNNARVAAMVEQNSASSDAKFTDPEAFAKAVAGAVAEANAEHTANMAKLAETMAAMAETIKTLQAGAATTKKAAKATETGESLT